MTEEKICEICGIENSYKRCECERAFIKLLDHLDKKILKIYDVLDLLEVIYDRVREIKIDKLSENYIKHVKEQLTKEIGHRFVKVVSQIDSIE